MSTTPYPDTDSLKKRIAYLKRKLLRLEEQQQRQERLDEINRRMIAHANAEHEKAKLLHQKQRQDAADFIASSCREIDGSMIAIAGLAELISEQTVETSLTNHARRLRTTINQLTALVDDLNFFSTLVSENPVVKDYFLFEELVTFLEKQLRKRVSNQNLEFELVCKPSRACLVTGDSLKLKKVLLLVLEYLTPATNNCRLQLTLETPEAKAESILVTFVLRGNDNSDLRQKLPESEENTSASSRACRGNFKLSLADQLVTVLGGSMRSEFPSGQELVFRLELPLTFDDRRETATYQNSARADYPGTQYTILLLSNADHDFQQLSTCLDEYPIHVRLLTEAHLPETALDIGPFRALFIDQDIASKRTLDSLFHDPETKPLPAFVLCSKVSNDQKTHFQAMGYSSIVSKPPAKTEILEIITGLQGERQPVLHPDESLDNRSEKPLLNHGDPNLELFQSHILESLLTELENLEELLEKDDPNETILQLEAVAAYAALFNLQEFSEIVYDFSKKMKRLGAYDSAYFLAQANSYLLRKAKSAESTSVN